MLEATHDASFVAQTGVIESRFLTVRDVDRLMELERSKWTCEQAAGRSEIERRIRTYPHLSVGAFSAESGKALASLFMKPISREQIEMARTWGECARIETPAPDSSRSLFGISLSSINADAVKSVFGFFWPHALRAGWRHIYLGSPLPGLKAWASRNPGVPVASYVWDKRNHLPRDPQLRYYHRKGFRRIVACKSEYFPHDASLNHGAILKAEIPLSSGALIWALLPISWLRGMRWLLFVLA